MLYPIIDSVYTNMYMYLMYIIVVYYQNFLKISIFVLYNSVSISSKIETSNERNTKARKLIILRQIYIDILQMSSSDWKCIRNMMCILTLMMTCTVWNNHRGKSKHHLQQRFRGMRREQWAIAAFRADFLLRLAASLRWDAT